MVNYIWIFLILVGIFFALLTGRIDVINNSILTNGKEGLDLILSILPIQRMGVIKRYALERILTFPGWRLLIIKWSAVSLKEYLTGRDIRSKEWKAIMSGGFLKKIAGRLRIWSWKTSAFPTNRHIIPE